MARFWVFNNDGWARLTLAEGESLATYYAGKTEEGWWSERDRYSHDGEAVVWEHMTDGADCDGRLSQNRECYCPLADLRTRGMDDDLWFEGDAIMAPQWRAVGQSRRDYTAEKAGY